MKKTISTIIVTYNRKNELFRCIDAVINQTSKTDHLIIVNNASTDGTEMDVVNKYGDSLTLINLPTNTGGSGGFYTGLKYAHESFNTDYYWMMDDDGYPSEKCLELLLSEADNYDYLMPVSIDINDHKKLSWAVPLKNKRKTESYDEIKKNWGKIMNFVAPFNGALLSRNCVEKVGYINKDFFIWGDELEHYYRCKKNKINPVSLVAAEFYHPAAKLPKVKIFFGLINVFYVESDLRMVCLARNYTYNYIHYDKKYKILLKFLMYTWLFLITRHGDFAGWKLYCASVMDGFKGDFTRHLKYLEAK